MLEYLANLQQDETGRIVMRQFHTAVSVAGVLFLLIFGSNADAQRYTQQTITPINLTGGAVDELRIYNRWDDTVTSCKPQPPFPVPTISGVGSTVLRLRDGSLPDEESVALNRCMNSPPAEGRDDIRHVVRGPMELRTAARSRNP